MCWVENLKLYKFNYQTGIEIENFKDHFGPVHCPCCYRVLMTGRDVTMKFTDWDNTTVISLRVREILDNFANIPGLAIKMELEVTSLYCLSALVLTLSNDSNRFQI